VDVAAPTARALRLTVERGSPVAALLVGIAAFSANATPVQILAAMSAGAIAFGAKAVVSLVALNFARSQLDALSRGITYKDARAFERAASASVAVFSARGTVLLGEPEIVAIEPIGAGDRGGDVGRVLSLAAGAETASTHPFAAAILRAARTRGVAADHVRNATVHAGLGVTASASTGERLVVGGRAIMLEEKIGVAATDARASELEALGRSVLLVALGDRLVGLIALQDGLRPGARAAVQKLLDARIEPVLMSGEARDTCETIGRSLDIEHVRPEVLPTDRGAEVRALSEAGSVVAVIGHAAGDDGALGAADVAVAMSSAGSTPGEWTTSATPPWPSPFPTPPGTAPELPSPSGRRQGSWLSSPSGSASRRSPSPRSPRSPEPSPSRRRPARSRERAPPGSRRAHTCSIARHVFSSSRDEGQRTCPPPGGHLPGR
jgi:cation transport ATPase